MTSYGTYLVEYLVEYYLVDTYAMCGMRTASCDGQTIATMDVEGQTNALKSVPSSTMDRLYGG
jgi:hypothetical protein